MTIYVNARFVTQPLTGVQRYAFEVCRYMKSMDDTIVFLSPRNIIRHEWAELLQVLAIGRSKGHLWEQSELPLFLADKKQVILFSPCNTGPLFCSRQALTLHDLSFKLYPAFNSFLFRTWYNFLVSRLCKKVRHIFTVSHSVKEEIVQHYNVNAGKITVTYNGVADAMKATPSTKLQKEKIIVTVGSLSQRKNMDFLISAFVNSGLCPEYTLVVIGQANPIYAYRQGEAAPGVQIIEDADDATLKDYYARAEIACFLSLYEGFGIPVLESLQFGCKVVCADISVFRELYQGYVYYCDPNNIQELTSLLQQLPAMKVLQQDNLQALNEKYSYRRSASIIYKTLSQL